MFEGLSGATSGSNDTSGSSGTPHNNKLQMLILQVDLLYQLKESFLIFEIFRNPHSVLKNDSNDLIDGENYRPRHETLDSLIFSSESQKVIAGVSLLQKIVIAVESSELSNVKSTVDRVKEYALYVESFFLTEFITSVQESPFNVDNARVSSKRALFYF